MVTWNYITTSCKYEEATQSEMMRIHLSLWLVKTLGWFDLLLLGIIQKVISNNKHN